MILLSILKIIGIVLLVLFSLLLLIVLVVLFVPIHYEACGHIEDPEGREELDIDALKESTTLSFRFSWLLHIVQGDLRWPGEPLFSLRILWISIDVSALAERMTDKWTEKEKDKKQAAPKERRRGSIKDTASGGIRMLKALLAEDDSGHSLLYNLMKGIGGCIQPILPTDWHVGGVVGLGDPGNAATLLEIEGFLLPMTGGRIWITPEYMLYRFDLEGSARGSIRLIRVACAAVRLALMPQLRALLSSRTISQQEERAAA